ncbi:hypothetical protein OS493_007364 [Desmophyllum pertusum]|uniref:Chitin-binding type-2 domain-containing protein n=1 Tax=Desmophyllum pertusum TaxID=174260 RepID=A0A9W9Z360_9CNID|nr:hypothetical protein OS493_007364 [Desmophyllum pertusum]
MANVKAIWSRYAQVTKGDSTYYGDYPGGGACALDPPSPLNNQPGWIMVAAGQYDFQKSLGCGMCIEITANGEQTSPSTGGPTPMKGIYKAYVGDLCGGCGQAGFDLYISGFGKYKTSFKAISCPALPGTEGNIQFRFTGSNAWSMKLQARNSNRIGRDQIPKEIQGNKALAANSWWTTLPGIQNDQNIPSDIQYSGFNPASNPENIKCYGQDGKLEQPIGSTTAPGPATGGPPSPTTQPIGGSTSTASPIGSTPPTSKPSGTIGSTTAPGPVTGVHPHQQPSRIGGSTPTASPIGSTPPTSKPSSLTRHSARKNPLGFNADPKDCKSFYHCANGVTYWKHCPNGLYFNPTVNVCDWPRNVKCAAAAEDKQDMSKIPGGRVIQIAKKNKCM